MASRWRSAAAWPLAHSPTPPPTWTASQFLQDEDANFWPPYAGLGFERSETLRYGENPHQRAALYVNPAAAPGIAQAEQLHGKAMSYNNYVDADAALRAAYDFDEPAVAVIKHNNPCGIAVATPGAADPIADAHAKAHACDPLSAYGGVIAANRPVTAEMARTVKGIFTEVVVAPGYEPEALEILREKKNLRLLVLPEGFSRDAIEYAPSPAVRSSRRPTACRLRATTRRTGPWLPASPPTRPPCATSNSRGVHCARPSRTPFCWPITAPQWASAWAR